MLAQRTARRTYRRPLLPPLRAASSRRRSQRQERAIRQLSSMLPPGGAGGPPEGPRPPTTEEIAWLVSEMRRFAVLARSLRVEKTNVPDVTQEAVKLALEAWGTWPIDAKQSARASMRRWLTTFLLRAIQRKKDKLRRSKEMPVAAPEQASTASAEGPVDVLNMLRALQDQTAPANWRAWVAYYVDGDPVNAIATAEGSPVPTIYFRLQRAREDFAAFWRRESLILSGPVVPRKQTSQRVTSRKGPK